MFRLLFVILGFFSVACATTQQTTVTQADTMDTVIVSPHNDDEVEVLKDFLKKYRESDRLVNGEDIKIKIFDSAHVENILKARAEARPLVYFEWSLNQACDTSTAAAPCHAEASLQYQHWYKKDGMIWSQQCEVVRTSYRAQTISKARVEALKQATNEYLSSLANLACVTYEK